MILDFWKQMIFGFWKPVRFQIDPVTAALFLLPTALNFFGGLFDDSEAEALGLTRDQIEENKRQFQELLPLKKATVGLQAGTLLSNIFEQQADIAGEIGRGKGVLSGAFSAGGGSSAPPPSFAGR